MDQLKKVADLIAETSGPTFLGFALIAAMWPADAVVQSVFRAGEVPTFGPQTRAFWKLDRSLLRAFLALFDHIYEIGRLKEPSVLRFIWVELGVLSLVAVTLSLTRPDITRLYLSYLAIGDGIAGVILFVIVNTIGDYFCVWKSRALMELLPKRSTLQLALLPVDYVLTGFLFSAAYAVIMGIFVLSIVFVERSQNEVDVLGGFGQLWTMFFSTPLTIWKYYVAGAPIAPRSIDATNVFPITLVVISSLWATLWNVAYSMTSVIILWSAGVAPFSRRLLDRLDFEGKPLRVNGLICGFILIVLGVVAAGVRRLFA
jgi:hypothetical protein